ncbi:MAG: Holliday junction resolvase RuvX [Bacteroidota bacterium]
MKTGKALGIDFGLKRTGLAITDALRIVASPLEAIHTTDLKKRVEQLIKQENISTIVLGESIHADGTVSDIGKKQHEFLHWLEKHFPDCEIICIDERNTSKEAAEALFIGGMKKAKRQIKGNLDKVSAAIILQRFLNSTQK